MDLIGNSFKMKSVRILNSTYSFKTPVFPHLAARLEGQNIQTEKIVKDFENRPSGFCIVEGAGGIEVPINDHEKMKDLMKTLHLPVLLVTSTRLGTINHTLLSVQALKQRGLYCLGLVLNDNPNGKPGDHKKQGLKELLEKETGLPVLFEVPRFEQLTGKELTEEQFLEKRFRGKKFIGEQLDAFFMTIKTFVTF